MKNKVFISYYFGDATFKGEVEAWLSVTGVEILSVNKRDLIPEVRVAAEKRIKEQISESSLLLILVGNDTHNRPFVDYEVAVAKSKQIPTFWMRLPNRNGAPPFEVRNIKSIEYSESILFQLIISLGIIKH